MQYPFLSLPKTVSRKIWVFPGLSQTGGGPLSTNNGTVYIGLQGSGPLITPSALAPNAQPILFELPMELNEVVQIARFLAYGTLGDGITIMYWL